MIKEWYIPITEDSMLGYKALKHRITKELCLFGRYGEMWQVSDTTYGVLIHSSAIAKKIAKLAKIDIPGKIDVNDEVVLNISAKLAPQIAKCLQIKKQLKSQLLIAKKHR